MIQSTPKLSKAKAPVLTIARSFLNNMMCNAINILADTIISSYSSKRYFLASNTGCSIPAL